LIYLFAESGFIHLPDQNNILSLQKLNIIFL